MKQKFMALAFICLFNSYAFSTEKLPTLIKEIGASTLPIGLYSPLTRSDIQILGTGFVVGDGSYLVTNYHVVSQVLDQSVVEYFVAIESSNGARKPIKALLLDIDPVHDVALLKLDKSLKPLALSENQLLEPGSDIAITGFPLGGIIGAYHATHKGIIAGITPDIIPAQNSDFLSAEAIKRLDKPFLIYQLDATAFPGNSGSPVYRIDNGEIIGILNKVLLKSGKESALSDPSGISYAIPVVYIKQLLSKHYSN